MVGGRGRSPRPPAGRALLLTDDAYAGVTGAGGDRATPTCTSCARRLTLTGAVGDAPDPAGRRWPGPRGAPPTGPRATRWWARRSPRLDPGGQQRAGRAVASVSLTAGVLLAIRPEPRRRPSRRAIGSAVRTLTAQLPTPNSHPTPTLIQERLDVTAPLVPPSLSPSPSLVDPAVVACRLRQHRVELVPRHGPARPPSNRSGAPCGSSPTTRSWCPTRCWPSSRPRAASRSRS